MESKEAAVAGAGGGRALDWRGAAVALSTAVLTAGAFAPLEWGWAAWVGWAPALWWARRGEKGALAWGYAGALGGWLGQLFWLTRVTWAGWAVLSAYCALYALPMLAFAKKWRGGAAGFELGCAVLWVGGESFRGWFGGGFPWNPLGVAAAWCRPVAQWAEWGGASGIGLVVMAANAAVAWVAGGGRKNRADILFSRGWRRGCAREFTGDTGRGTPGCGRIGRNPCGWRWCSRRFRSRTSGTRRRRR